MGVQRCLPLAKSKSVETLLREDIKRNRSENTNDTYQSEALISSSAMPAVVTRSSAIMAKLYCRASSTQRRCVSEYCRETVILLQF